MGCAELWGNVLVRPKHISHFSPALHHPQIPLYLLLSDMPPGSALFLLAFSQKQVSKQHTQSLTFYSGE